MGHDRVGPTVHVSTSEGVSLGAARQQGRKKSPHDETGKTLGEILSAGRPLQGVALKTANLLDFLRIGPTTLKLTAFAAARKADSAAVRAGPAPQAGTPRGEPRAVADFAKLRAELEMAVPKAAALSAEATLNTGRERASGKIADPRTHLNRAGALIQSNLKTLRSAVDVLRLQGVFNLLGVSFEQGREALEAALQETKKPAPFDAGNPDHMEALRKLARSPALFDVHLPDNTDLIQEAKARSRVALKHPAPLEPASPGTLGLEEEEDGLDLESSGPARRADDSQTLEAHFAPVVTERIDALMARSLDAMADCETSLAGDAVALRHMERTLVTEMVLLELPGLALEGVSAHHTGLAKHHLNHELTEAVNRLTNALDSSLGEAWREPVPPGLQNGNLANVIETLRNGKPSGLDPADRDRLMDTLLEDAAPDAKHEIATLLKEAEDLARALDNEKWLEDHYDWEPLRLLLSKWTAEEGTLETARAALLRFFQANASAGIEAGDALDLHKACAAVDPAAVAAFLGQGAPTRVDAEIQPDQGPGPEVVKSLALMLFDRCRAVENLRTLSDRGVLNQDLVRLLADGQPQMRDLADNPRPDLRAMAANTFAALTQLATTGELPPEILGRFDRHQDLNRGLHRAAAEARGEPPEVGEARADLELAKRRVVDRLLTLDPRRGARAVTFSGRGLNGVRLDPTFMEAIREKNPAAGREIGLLLTHVALLQRLVEPFNQVRDAGQALAAAEALGSGQQGQNRIGRAEKRLASWETVAAVARAEIALERATAAHGAAEGELRKIKGEREALGATATGADEVISLDKRWRTADERFKRLGGKLAEAVGELENARRRLDDQGGVPSLRQPAEAARAVQRVDKAIGKLDLEIDGLVKTSFEQHQSLLVAELAQRAGGSAEAPITELERHLTSTLEAIEERRATRFGLLAEKAEKEELRRREDYEPLPAERALLDPFISAEDLTNMGLPGDGDLVQQVRALVSAGLVSGTEVARTTAVMNQVIKGVIHRPIGQQMIRESTDLTDEQKANLFLDRIFRAVTGSPAHNLRADDPAVRAGFRARTAKLERALPGEGRAVLNDARRELNEAMAQLAEQGAQLQRLRQNLADSEAALATVAAELGMSNILAALGDIPTLAETPQCAAAVPLLEAIRLRQALDKAEAGLPPGVSTPSKDDSEKRYQELCEQLHNIDFNTLTLGTEPSPVDVNRRIRELASDEVPENAPAAGLQNKRELIEFARMLGKTAIEYPARIDGLVDAILQTGERIQGAKQTLEGALPQEHAAFLRDTIRAAVLSARPQTLDLNHRRFDQFDASAHRATVDRILGNWGIDVDAHRSLIDEVVFSAPSLTRPDFEAIGAAVADETVKAYDLERWLQDMGGAEAEGAAPTEGAERSGFLEFFRQAGDRARLPREEVERILSMVRSMAIQAKLKISVGNGKETSISVSVGIADAGVSAASSETYVIEIKRGKNGYEVRFRVGRAAGGAASAGVGGTLGVSEGGVNASLTAGRAENEGVSIHFASVEAVQAFLERILTMEEVSVSDWQDLSGWEAATQSARQLGASIGVGGGLGTSLGLLKAMLWHRSYSAGLEYKGAIGGYKNAFATEIKEKAVSILSLRRDTQYLALTGVSPGTNTAAQASELDPEVESQANVKLPDIGAADSKVGTLLRLTRRKDVHTSDGIFSEAGYFTAVPAFSRDPKKVLEQFLVKGADRKQFMAAFEDEVSMDDKTQTFREWIAEALAKARPNESIVIESKMRPAVVEQIQQRMERVTLRERDLPFTKPEREIRQILERNDESSPDRPEHGLLIAREKVEAEIVKLRKEVETLRRDPNSYQPEAILLVPARETNRTDSLNLVYRRWFRSGVAALRQGTAYVPAPKPSTDTDQAAALKTGAELKTEIADRFADDQHTIRG